MNLYICSIPKRGNFCICQKSDLFAEISHPQNTSVSFHIYVKVLTLSSLQDSLKTAFLYSSDLVTQKYSLNMYIWRRIISGSIVLIISYSSRTAIFYWRTKRSSDKCIRRWQSEASKLTSLTDRLSSSAFLPRMVKLSFVLSRFYCDLLNPNRSRIKKKKKKERQNRENYHGELCLNKSHEGKEPKTIWLQIWEISNWYFFCNKLPILESSCIWEPLRTTVSSKQISVTRFFSEFVVSGPNEAASGSSPGVFFSVLQTNQLEIYSHFLPQT